MVSEFLEATKPSIFLLNITEGDSASIPNISFFFKINILFDDVIFHLILLYISLIYQKIFDVLKLD